MSIVVNGIPKHGTHALLKAVELLGVPVSWRGSPGAILDHVGIDRKDEVADWKHLFILRNPKDAFISWMRWKNLPLTSGFIQSRLQNLQDPEGNYLEFCLPYLDWVMEDSVHVVRYEDLISEQDTIDAIADYLEVPRRNDVLQNLPGHTRTWNPEHSNHKTLSAWDNGVEQVWRGIGGEYLMETLKYGS